MTRPIDDWVQDNLINPAALTSCLPLELLKNTMKNSKIYRTYPDLNNSSIWYKTLTGKDFLKDDDFLTQYYKNYYNFFNYKESALKVNINEAKKIDFDLYNFYKEIYNYEKNTIINSRDLIKIMDSLKKINNFFKLSKFKDISKLTEETINIIKDDKKINKKKIDNLLLKNYFGKELCYVSFINL
jgi:hypothetical protein